MENYLVSYHKVFFMKTEFTSKMKKGVFTAKTNFSSNWVTTWEMLDVRVFVPY